MKKLLSIVLAFVMVLSIAACGNEEGSPAVTETSAPAPETQTTAPAETQEAQVEFEEDPVEIHMAFYVYVPPADVERIENAINAISLPEANVTVKLHPMQIGEYNQQISLMISGNEQLDLMSTFFAGPAAFTSMFAANQLKPLNELLEEYGQGILETVRADYLETTTFDGNTYAVPMHRDIVSNTYFSMRKDILEQVGMLEKAENAQTMDDITEIFAAVKEQTDLIPLAPAGAYGVLNFSPIILYGNIGEAPKYEKLLQSYVVAMESNPTKAVCLYETEEYKEGLKLLEAWNDAGYIHGDAVTSDENNYMYVASGSCFSYFFSAQEATYMDTVGQSGYEMVTLNMGSEIVSTTSVNQLNWVIPVTAKEEEGAMRFMNLLYTNKEIVDILNYGEKDVDYYVQEDGTYNYMDGKDAMTTGWNVNLSWEFGNQYLAGVWNGSAPDLREQSWALNENPTVSPLLGFVVDTAGLDSQIAACTSAYNEYDRSLNCGVMDVDTALPQYIEKLKVAGIDDLVVAVQEQLDAWLAQK